MIPLNDPAAQANAMKIIIKLPNNEKKKILFYFTTIKASMDLFLPPLNPAADVSYHDKRSVLNKLCDLYLMGNFSLLDLHNTLEESYDVWKLALYNMLTEDEQQYHQYLTVEPPKESKKTLEKQYLDDDINLQEYNDLKFPERKRRKDLENMLYPLPFEYQICIICKEDSGCIKCMHCNNHVCRACVTAFFLTKETAEGSFLLLHRRYCTRFGRLPYIELVAIPPTAYLKELGMTGKEAADAFYEQRRDALLIPELIMNEEEGEADDVLEEEKDEDDNDDDDVQMSKLLSAEGARKRKYFIKILTTCLHKYVHCFKQIQSYQVVIDNPNRSSHLIARMIRLKEKTISRLDKNHIKVHKLIRLLEKYDKKTEVVHKLVSDVYREKDRTERMLCCNTLAEFEEKEKLLEEEQTKKEMLEKQKANAALLNQYL